LFFDRVGVFEPELVLQELHKDGSEAAIYSANDLEFLLAKSIVFDAMPNLHKFDDQPLRLSRADAAALFFFGERMKRRKEGDKATKLIEERGLDALRLFSARQYASAAHELEKLTVSALASEALVLPRDVQKKLRGVILGRRLTRRAIGRRHGRDA